MSLLLRKATELGVTHIVPMFTERVVVRNLEKIERWQRIMNEASKQCFRNKIPKISTVLKFEEVVNRYKNYDKKIILSPSAPTYIKDFFNKIDKPRELVVLVGPEGGFSSHEIEIAKHLDFISINLGNRILRAETVPLVFLSHVGYVWGN